MRWLTGWLLERRLRTSPRIRRLIEEYQAATEQRMEQDLASMLRMAAERERSERHEQEWVS